VATATTNGRPARRAVHRSSAASEPAGIEFLVFEDNGRGYHWTIVDGAGESPVQSGSFASNDRRSTTRASCGRAPAPLGSNGEPQRIPRLIKPPGEMPDSGDERTRTI
jgi:hypothetical protein